MRIAQKQTMRNRRKVLEAYCYGSHQVYNIADNEYRLHGRSLSLESENLKSFKQARSCSCCYYICVFRA